MPALRSTSYCRIKEMGYANRIPRVKPVFLLPTAEQLFGGDEFTLQHDLAPARNAKSTKTKTISGLPYVGYRSCLSRQTLWILIPSKIFGESQRGWLLVDRYLWSS